VFVGSWISAFLFRLLLWSLFSSNDEFAGSRFGYKASNSSTSSPVNDLEIEASRMDFRNLTSEAPN